MKERELQMIVSNSSSTLKDVAQLIRLFLYLHPITGTPSEKGFSMFMDFLRRRLTVESEEDRIHTGSLPKLEVAKVCKKREKGKDR